MDLHSHGVMRIPQYLAEIESGTSIRARNPTSFGQLRHASPAMDGAASDRLLACGWSMLSFLWRRRPGSPWRTAATSATRVASAPIRKRWRSEFQLVGLAVCNGSPSGHWVAAFGGRDGRISTNPIAFGWPVAGRAPVVADFSTAVVPEGVVGSCGTGTCSAPEGYLRDAGGHTGDPGVLYANPKGAIQPLGGDLGYRGTALALFVEILTTMLNDDAVDDALAQGHRYGHPGDRAGRASPNARGLSDHIRASPPLDPSKPVLMPGDRERAAAARARRFVSTDRHGTPFPPPRHAPGLTMPEPVEHW